MRQFIVGCLVGALVVGGAAIFFIIKIENQPIQFASKGLVKFGDKVIFQGSVYGKGDASERPVNNYIEGECSKTTMSCRLSTMDEISKGHVGAIWTETIPIRSWEVGRIVADSKAMSSDEQQCNWYEIVINPQSERIDYTRFPNEKAKPDCAKFSSEKVHRWTIENGPAWLTNADGTKRY
jgi:hypothetical protein